jgi:hypothetical protein
MTPEEADQVVARLQEETKSRSKAVRTYARSILESLSNTRFEGGEGREWQAVAWALIRSGFRGVDPAELLAAFAGPSTWRPRSGSANCAGWSLKGTPHDRRGSDARPD